MVNGDITSIFDGLVSFLKSSIYRAYMQYHILDCLTFSMFKSYVTASTSVQQWSFFSYQTRSGGPNISQYFLRRSAQMTKRHHLCLQEAIIWTQTLQLYVANLLLMFRPFCCCNHVDFYSTTETSKESPFQEKKIELVRQPVGREGSSRSP